MLGTEVAACMGSVTSCMCITLVATYMANPMFVYVGACKDFSFLCNNGKCIAHALVCNQVNNCGDNSDEPLSCFKLPDTGTSTDIIGKFFGGIFGGVAGFIVLLVAIIVIIIVTCVCNKRCPLYKRRQRERPPVVVIDGIQPAPEENANENLSLIKNDEFDGCNIKKGA